MVKIYYTTYCISVSYINNIYGINVELYMYTPPSAVPIKQFTIVCMQARMYTLADNLLLLEGIQMVAFSGDPASNVYELSFLENNTMDIVLHGIVMSSTVE
jgi:hypothetical protein